MNRYERLDDIRGITLFSMILFHGVWDLVFLFGADWDWFHTDLAFLWQQSICWTFILLSGFCWSLGKRKLRRGLVVSGAGAAISFVTMVFMPDQRICFGILTFLGAAMLLLIPLHSVLQKVPAKWGMGVCAVLFIVLYGINDGYIGLLGMELFILPEKLYEMGTVTTFLGFTDKWFYSADYFSLFPWIFLYLTGYFGYRILGKNEKLTRLKEQKSWGQFWNVLGKKSLLIYILHQPIVYGVLLVLDKLQVI